MAKRTVHQQVKNLLSKEAYAIIQWWHENYDEVWVVRSNQYHPSHEWAEAFVFQQFVLKSPNGFSNSSVSWGISEVRTLSLEKFNNIRIGEFTEFFPNARLFGETLAHIQKHGFEYG